ncbi:MAG TPA: BatA domain-containing protein, partial [Chloroflexota bacterium]|nr:BatA domain-containing protein [Chloroflexota bacterium]
MIFAAPWILVALLALPVIWWLIRITPPTPRSETFPAVRFLLGLNATEETPARTPPWLMALRMLAAALVIIGLARPVLDAGAALAGRGPVLLVVDNGWASASDWAQRKQAASVLLDRVERAGRKVALLPTASDGSGSPIAVSAIMPVADLRARLAALQPQAWPPDRAAATRAIHDWPEHDGASVAYIPDGLTDGAGFPDFANALQDIGPITEICCDAQPAPLLLPPTAEADRLIIRLAQLPRPVPTHAVVLGESGDDRTLARSDITIPPGATVALGPMALPPELRNRLTRLVLEGPPSAGSVVLLDERWRRRPVGLLAGDLATADTPFVGSLYFVRRALGPYNEIRDGSAAALMKRDISVLILADRPLQAGPERDALTEWVRKGGLLIRFAGPRTAEAAGNDTDTLLPVHLLAGDRQLGGAMSWSQPAGLAAFPSESPFTGLTPTDDVKVERQVLAEP